MTDYGDLVADVVDSWKAGAEPDSKAVLDEHPELLEYESHVLELAGEEYRLRFSRGDTIVPGQFCRKFASHSQTVRRIFEFQSAIAGAVEKGRPEEFWPDVEDRVLKFELVREIGRGAMSRVFTARESDLGDRIVALKLTSCPSDEAATLGRLRHPRIVRVYSVDVCPRWDLRAICMEYEGSRTLQHVVSYVRESGIPEHGLFVQQIAESVPPSQIDEQQIDTVLARDETVAIDEKPQSDHSTSLNRTTSQDEAAHAGVPNSERDRVDLEHAPELELADVEEIVDLGGATKERPYQEVIAALMIQAAEGLEYTHEQGVVHHDIKPSNILLTGEGTAKLLDFNLSRDTQLDRARKGGTIPYMSPEQLAQVFLDSKTAEVDGRADLFSLGIIFFELVSGQLPWGGGWSGDIQRDAKNRAKAIELAPRRLTEIATATSPELANIIHRAIQLDPAKRFQTAREFIDATQAWLDNQGHIPQPEPIQEELQTKTGKRTAITLSVILCVVMFLGIAPFFNSKRQPTLDEALAEAGQLAESGQASLAITKLKSMKKQYGANARYHASIGTLRVLVGGDQPAGESFKRALELARQDQLSFILNDVAYCFARKRNFGQAIKRWNICLDLDPENPIARINLARYSAQLAYQGQETPGMLPLKEAMLVANEVSALYPNNMHISYASALVHTVAVNHGVSTKAEAELHIVRTLRLGYPAQEFQGALGFSRVDWSETVDDAVLNAFDRGQAMDAKWLAHSVLAQLTSAQYILDITKK